MRKTTSTKKCLASVACLLAFGLAGTAGAVDISFDEFAIGTVITNQYAGLGVNFAAVSGSAPIIAGDGANPTSPILSPAGGPGPFLGDFDILLDPGFDYVRFDSGFWDGVGTAVIQVYGPGNTLLITFSNTLVGIETFAISGFGDIERIYFNSLADIAGGGIDNFVATPEPTTAAMFALGLLGIAVGRRRTAALAA